MGGRVLIGGKLASLVRLKSVRKPNRSMEDMVELETVKRSRSEVKSSFHRYVPGFFSGQF
jgi:hypothetical protein